jgi:hypothetical protein
MVIDTLREPSSTANAALRIPPAWPECHPAGTSYFNSSFIPDWVVEGVASDGFGLDSTAGCPAGI